MPTQQNIGPQGLGASGFSGQSGFSGTSGFSGKSGFSGAGTSGFSGASGAAGGGGGLDNESAIALLGSATIDLNDNSAKQPIYTVPIGKVAVVTGIVMRSFSAASTLCDLSYGWNAGADNLTINFTPGDCGGTVTTATALVFQPVFVTGTNPATMGANLPLGNAGDGLGAQIGTEEGSPLTCVVDIFGYLYDA